MLRARKNCTVWDEEIAGVRGALGVARQEEKILVMTTQKPQLWLLSMVW